MKIRPLILLLALFNGFFVLGCAVAKDVVLLTVYQDSDKKVPLEGEFYYVYKNGAIAGNGTTDATGRILYSARSGEVIKDGYFVVNRIGEYFFTLDAHHNVETRFLGRRALDSIVSSCDDRRGECRGKGFYAIRLKGVGTNFSNEPYDILVNGKHTKGVVSEEGYIFLKFDNPPASTNATVTLCGKASARVAMGRVLYQSKATWAVGGEGEKLDCSASRMDEYKRSNQAFNEGLPVLLASWSPGSTPEEEMRLEEASKKAELKKYMEMARANDDPLSWLGPLPQVWSKDEFEARRGRLSKRIMEDVRNLRDDWKTSFVCKTPAAVGPVPNMNDVNAFMEQFPDSMNSSKFGKLIDAGRLGNWLARAQLYVISNQFQLIDEPRVSAYRNLQLAEWLHERKIGGLYREFGELLAASGYYSDAPSFGSTAIDVFAAMNQSYPAQYTVGSELKGSDDANDRALGKRMMDCALSALPAYRTLLTRRQ